MIVAKTLVRYRYSIVGSCPWIGTIFIHTVTRHKISLWIKLFIVDKRSGILSTIDDTWLRNSHCQFTLIYLFDFFRIRMYEINFNLQFFSELIRVANPVLSYHDKSEKEKIHKRCNCHCQQNFALWLAFYSGMPKYFQIS